MDEFNHWLTDLMMDEPMSFHELEQMKNIQVFPIVPTGEAKKSYECVSDLHQLDLQYYFCSPLAAADGSNQQFHEFVAGFVLRSVNTLVELRMLTTEFLKLFNTVKELKFPNLRRLSLAAPNTMSMQEEILVLKQLNLPKLCPILQHLELKNKSHYRSAVKDDGTPVEVSFHGLDQSQLPIGISLESRHGGLYRQDYLKFLKKVYPNIKGVRILKWRALDQYKLSSVFVDFPALEYFEINIFRFPRDVHLRLDALLSGINYDEALLLSNTRRYTQGGRNLRILPTCVVPVRPSLFNAKNLLELKISEQVSEDAFMGGNIRKESHIGEITENIPVRRVRNFLMTFETQNDFNHILHRLLYFSKLIRD